MGKRGCDVAEHDEAVGPVHVEIVGAPVACEKGVQDTWREVALWAARQLHSKYGGVVSVRYYDLFDADCPPLPPGAQLPLVYVCGEVLSSGGKVSLPAIRNRLEECGIRGTVQP